MIYLLSYPRSGNTWLRYIIEFLTNRPTVYYLADWERDPPIGSRVGSINIDVTQPVVAVKRHWLEEKDWTNASTDTLVLLIRDYKEAMVRHHKEGGLASLDARFEKEMQGLANPECDYIKAIQHFDIWPGPKLLIYYEDLISDPPTSIKKLAELLPTTTESTQILVNNLPFHIKQGISSYHAKSFTEGKQLVYHQQEITSEQRERIKHHLETNFSNIYKQYLTRYD